MISQIDGGAIEADGGASAPVGPTVATPLLKTTINLDKCAFRLMVLHQGFIKAFKGICGMF